MSTLHLLVALVSIAYKECLPFERTAQIMTSRHTCRAKPKDVKSAFNFDSFFKHFQSYICPSGCKLIKGTYVNTVIFI